MTFFFVLIHILFLLALGFYLITCLQWFSYKFERILFHFTKPLWHVWFLIIPIVLHFLSAVFGNAFFAIYFLLIYLPSLIFWHKKLDKKLVFTPRIKRFFGFLLLFSTIFTILCAVLKTQIFPLFLPLAVAFLASFAYEKYLFLKFKNLAMQKLTQIPNLLIVQITASYGKTSIKNFLYQILSCKFNCYKTPRSVNTLGGLMKDINDDLPLDTQIYIAEAGARLSGDIAEITQFLRPQLVVVGEIGAQHIEYFKSVENVRKTKLEALQSPNLQKAFLHTTTNLSSGENMVIYNENLQILSANLDGIKFSLKFGDEFKEFFAPILGEFNAENLAVCIKIAEFLGLKYDEIYEAVANLQSVEHRLQKIEANGKIIIDDSFNGNLAGMLSSYELVRTFSGRKVIITPGIVESTKEDNEKLGEKINEIFDLVMVTGELNLAILQSKIAPEKLIIIKDKSKLTENLAKFTMKGDLILFSNDAPSFI